MTELIGFCDQHKNFRTELFMKVSGINVEKRMEKEFKLGLTDHCTKATGRMEKCMGEVDLFM